MARRSCHAAVRLGNTRAAVPTIKVSLGKMLLSLLGRFERVNNAATGGR